MDRSADNLGQTISNIQRDLEELKSNQGNGSGGGGGGGGGEEYFAGNGINISQSNTISVDTNVVATQTDLESKQDTLTAGSHISISNNNTISATGIPTKISDLINDSDFSSIEIVNSLPSTGTENVLYLVPSASLPNGYQRYSYIDFAFKFPKTAYFPLTNVWTTANWKMEFDIEIHENYDYNNLFGRLDAVDADNEIWGNSANQYRWRAFGWTGPWDASMVGGTLFAGTRYVISHDNLGSSFVTVSNGYQTLSREKLTGTAQPSWQFAFGHRNGSRQFYGKVFGYRSWDANGLVDDLVPARRLSDNKDGFYNLVDNTFRPLEGDNVSEVIGGAWSSNAYNGFVWTGSTYIQIGRDVYATSQLINDSGFLTSVDWDGIEDKPTFATVATTGDYDDLTNKPTIPAAQIQSDWTQSDNTKVDFIKNKPTIDSALSDSSTNAVQNKVVTGKINEIDRYYRSLVPVGTAIASNKDLNTLEFLSVGKYFCSTNVVAQTLSNCPTTQAFMMEVFSPLSTTIDNESTGTWVYRLRMITTLGGEIYVSGCNSNSTAGNFSYSGWKKITNSADIASYNLYNVIEIEKSLTATTDWTDTGISGTDLDTGSYMVQVYTGSNYAGLWSERWTGVMTWFNGGTNSSEADEILLHNSGHASNGVDLFLRTKRNSSPGNLSLQYAFNTTSSTATTIKFSFRRYI